jgi:two-component system copper resistance phosphate regulon response regulator CusR
MEASSVTAVKNTATDPHAGGASVLIVEDDLPLAHFLRRGFEAGHHSVAVVQNAEGALEALSERPYDLLLTDLNLPAMDGLSLVKRVRATVPRVLILVLSARASLEDRIVTLDSGADDYVVKPFSLQELLARTRALLRRCGNHPGRVMQVADLVLSRPEYRVQRAGKPVELTAREFDLLEYLMANAHHVVTRAMIMENVWRSAYDGTTNVVDVYIKYIRDKVDAEPCPKLVRTIRGVGYMLTDN